MHVYLVVLFISVCYVAYLRVLDHDADSAKHHTQ